MSSGSKVGDSNNTRPQNPPLPSAKPKKKKKHMPPQDTINKIWSRFSAKKFSKATIILPISKPFNQTTIDPPPQTFRDNLLVSEEFNRAVQESRTRVKKLIKECRRVNMRYRDPDFDIDWDFKMEKGYCSNNLKDDKFVISGSALSSDEPELIRRHHSSQPSTFVATVADQDVLQIPYTLTSLDQYVQEQYEGHDETQTAPEDGEHSDHGTFVDSATSPSSDPSTTSSSGGLVGILRGLMERNPIRNGAHVLGSHVDEVCSICSSCGIYTHVGYYQCKTCPGGYNICLSCADKGLCCPGLEHTSMKRIYNDRARGFVDDKPHTVSRGLRVLINGQLVAGIGDTGSEETIVSEARCREMGWNIVPSYRRIGLGNQRSMLSTGTALLPISFPDRPGEIIQVLVRVVKNFSFDILLGRPFLKATQTMEKYISRFTRCFFPTRNLWAFYRLGETAERFNAVMANRVPFAALPDTGSRRNVMSVEWAVRHGFYIRTEKENTGWITFPSGPDEATIGQVHSWISLPGGKRVPIVFDILPTSRLPVVLGIDFVLDNNLYQDYASSFTEDMQEETKTECLGMGYKPWYAITAEKIARKARGLMRGTTFSGNGTTPPESQQDSSISPPANLASQQPSETRELKRQREWDERYSSGKFASIEEWNEEMLRRRAHEKAAFPGIADEQSMSLIACQPATIQRQSTSSTDPDETILRLSYFDNDGVPMGSAGEGARFGISLDAMHELEPGMETLEQSEGRWTSFGELEAPHWRT